MPDALGHVEGLSPCPAMEDSDAGACAPIALAQGLCVMDGTFPRSWWVDVCIVPEVLFPEEGYVTGTLVWKVPSLWPLEASGSDKTACCHVSQSGVF